MTTLLLLARHAAHAQLGGILTGRGEDSGLTEGGRAQARRLAAAVARYRPGALFTSPRRRAFETAEIVASALRLSVHEETVLDEIDFGAWTGCDFAKLHDDAAWRRWNEQRATARPPGGEAMHEVQSRVLRWTDWLVMDHPEGALLAVSHADVIKAEICAYLGLTLDAHWRFDIAPASLSALELWPGGGRVSFVNDCSALSREP